MSSPVRTPTPPPRELGIFFIADLASVSHDQDFEFNFFFFVSGNVHQYIEKFSEHQSPRQANLHHKWKKKKLCVHFVFQSFLIIF